MLPFTYVYVFLWWTNAHIDAFTCKWIIYTEISQVSSGSFVRLIFVRCFFFFAELFVSHLAHDRLHTLIWSTSIILDLGGVAVAVVVALFILSYTILIVLVNDTRYYTRRCVARISIFDVTNMSSKLNGNEWVSERTREWECEWVNERDISLCSRCSFNLYSVALIKFHRATQLNFSLNMTGDLFLIIFIFFSVQFYAVHYIPSRCNERREKKNCWVTIILLLKRMKKKKWNRLNVQNARKCTL